jgi:hypothetical protein
MQTQLWAVLIVGQLSMQLGMEAKVHATVILDIPSILYLEFATAILIKDII